MRTSLHVPLLLAVLALAGCGGRVQGSPAPASLDRLYQDAITDAAVYRAANVRTLRPALPDSTGAVRVVTLTSWTGYRVGADTLSREVWVTGVPEVRDSCRTMSGDLALGLQQFLGLPPGYSLVNFVEMYVRPGDLFRPAADDAVDTTLPCADTIPAARCGQQFPADASPGHVRWMAEGMMTRWELPGGFPWTRLGYTYNWRPGSPRYGASEYVVRARSPVTVLSITPYAEYCGRSG